MREAGAAIPEELGRVCGEIATERDPTRIAQALYACLEPLMQVAVVVVFVFDSARGRLRRHAVEKGRELALSDFDLTEPESYAGRAARTRSEIHIEAEEGARPGSRIPGTETTRSLWFAPMFQDGQLMGVLSVQSTRVGSYGDREKSMFRFLADCVGRSLAAARGARG